MKKQPPLAIPESGIILLHPATRSESPNVASEGTLELTNSLHSHRVAYKIKTTAPKSYLVKPSSGIIEGGSSVNIQLSATTMNVDSDGKADRFLIQSFVEDPTEPILMPIPKEFWSKGRDAFFDQRLHVRFSSGPSQASSTPPPVPAEATCVSESPTMKDITNPEGTSVLERQAPEELHHGRPVGPPSSRPVPKHTQAAPPAPSHPVSRTSTAPPPASSVPSMQDDSTLTFTPLQVVALLIFVIFIMKSIGVL